MLPERYRKKAQLRAACPLLEQEPRLELKVAAIIRLMVRIHTYGKKKGWIQNYTLSMDIELFFKADKLG